MRVLEFRDRGEGREREREREREMEMLERCLHGSVPAFSALRSSRYMKRSWKMKTCQLLASNPGV